MFFMNRTSRLGLAGIGACVLGLVMSVGALAFYPHPAGSNVSGGVLEIVFLALFFLGELIGLFGLVSSHLPGGLQPATWKKL